MALRELLIELGIKVDRSDERAVNTTLSTLKKAAGGLVAAFAAIKAGDFLVDIVRDVAVLGDEIATSAERIGVGAEELQKLRFAADRADISVSELDFGLRTLTKSIGDAEKGTGLASEAFEQLGVSTTNQDGTLRSQTDVILSVAEAFQGLTDQTRKTALAQDIFGARAGGALVPLLNKGKAGIEELMQTATDYGVVLGQDLIDAGSAYDDAQKDLNAAFQGLKLTIGSALVPALVSAVDAFTALVRALRPVVQSFATTIVPLFGRVLRVARGLASAVSVVASAFASLGPVFGPLAAALAALALAFGTVGISATLAGLQAALAFVVAAAPLILTVVLLGAIGAAIFLLIEDFVALGEGAESVTGTIVQGFLDLIDETGTVFGAITEIFETAIDYWAGSDGIFGNAIAAIIATIQTLVDAFFAAGEAIGKFFSDVYTAVGEGFDAVIGPIRDGLASLRGGVSRVTSLFNSGAEVARQTAAPVTRSAGVTANQTNQTSINVDARGSANPAAVGTAVGSAAEGAREATNRRLVRSLGVATP